MAKVTITTDGGEVIEVLVNVDLPTRGTRLALEDLAASVWEAVERARKHDHCGAVDTE